MGYDVHIARAAYWPESESHPIELDEWVRYVRSDPEMRLDGYAEAAIAGGGVLRSESPGIAVWVAYSGHGRDGNMAWFDHRAGRVVVKNPDEEILDKMVRIAGALGARVIGDDVESYPAEAGDEPRDRAEAALPWWKRLLSRRS